MAKAFVVSPKLSDAATLTANNAVGGAGATNVQKARPRLVWRSTTITPYLEGNFGSAKAVDTLVLGFINGRSGDTFRLRMATSQANLLAAPVFDSTSLTVWPVGSNLVDYNRIHRALTFTQQTLQWFRIDFDFTANADAYVEMGRLILGKRIEPIVSVSKGWSAGLEEAITETIDLGGEESPRPMGVVPSLSAMWHDLLFSEAAAMRAMMLERGSARDIALVIDQAQVAYPMFGIAIGRVKQSMVFEQTLMATTDISTGHHFTVGLTVSEMAPVQMA